MTAEKNAIVKGLLNFRVRMFLKSAVKKSKKIAKARRNFIAATLKKHPDKYRKNNKFSENSDLKRKVKVL